MDKETIEAKIKDIEKEIKHTRSASYKELLERRLQAYKNLLPKARRLCKLKKGDVQFVNGSSRADAILAAWQRKFKGVNPHEYIDY